MAEKSFGVKEINLIGASGTPTIESPNNLNLNAVNVAISTNVSIGGTLTVSGNVSVGGTLTYEDVTNIDSIGIVTAGQGVRVNADSAFSGGALATNYISVGASQDLKLYHNGVTNYIVANDAGLILRADDIMLQSDDTSGRAVYLDGGSNRLELGYDGSAAAYITSSNVQFLKSITASADSTHDIGTNSVRFQNAYVDTYYGDGSNLTNLPAPDIQVSYTVTANGSSAYRFAGNGVVSTEDNPDLYLIRGKKYRFVNNSGGSHPFQIRVSDGGSAYSTGVTNNGASSGNIDFAPTFDSPAKVVYQCTSHGGMVGNIYLSGGKHDTNANQFHIECNLSSDVSNYDVNSNYGTPLIFNNVVTTRGTAASALNTSNGKVTVPVDGVYFLEGSAYTTNGDYWTQAWFTEGTSRMQYSDWVIGTNNNRINAAGMHYLTANTQVGFHPYGGSNVNVTIVANQYHTYFRVTLVG